MALYYDHGSKYNTSMLWRTIGWHVCRYRTYIKKSASIYIFYPMFKLWFLWIHFYKHIICNKTVTWGQNKTFFPVDITIQYSAIHFFFITTLTMCYDIVFYLFKITLNTLKNALSKHVLKLCCIILSNLKTAFSAIYLVCINEIPSIYDKTHEKSRLHLFMDHFFYVNRFSKIIFLVSIHILITVFNQNCF